jgi:hypothetical protein
MGIFGSRPEAEKKLEAIKKTLGDTKNDMSPGRFKHLTQEQKALEQYLEENDEDD